MINKISISGYKSIKSQEISLNKINIFIGANGSGKSNFLSFFEFLKYLYDRKLQEYITSKNGADMLLFNGGKNTDNIHFKISFNNETTAYSATLKKAENDKLYFVNENTYYHNNPYPISDHGLESKIKTEKADRAEYIKLHLNDFMKYHFHDTSYNSAFVKMSNIKNDIHYLYSKGDNLAAYLYNIQQNNPTVYNVIVKIIQSVAPYFSDFYFYPNDSDYLYINWKDKYSDNVYGTNNLSDGTLRFIALTTLFMQPKMPNTIIIDEPELGLHPFAIAKLAGMIKSVANAGYQVCIATQSTDLINHFNPEDIITVDTINGESVFKRLDSEELNIWLEDYSIGELWKMNVIETGNLNY
jgi:predicted ATPase